MDTIPSELGTLILQNVQDMKSLWSLVQASSYIYRIFSRSREKFLPIVIGREIGPILMGDALAALLSSQFLPIDQRGKERSQSFIRGPPKAKALEWIEECYLPMSGALRWIEPYLFGPEKVKWMENHKEENAWRRTSLTVAEAMKLWELHKAVRFMANLYVQATLPVFNQSIDIDPEEPVEEPGEEPVLHTIEELSFIERQRLFRSIYRFIIFGNLFAPSAPGVWEEDELSEYFLCRFPAWEVEEMNSIYDFMTDRILQKWQEMENDEFNRLALSPGLWDTVPHSDSFTSYWENNFFSRASKLSFEGVQAFLVTLPIPDLKAIFQAKGEILGELVRKRASECPASREPFLGEALGAWPDHFPVNPGGEGLRRNAERGAFREGHKNYFVRDKDDDAMIASRSWYWANRWHPREIYVEPAAITFGAFQKGFEGLRRIGHVFWENSRCQELESYEPLWLGEKVLELFPRPSFEDQLLSVEERIRQLESRDCGKAIGIDDSKSKLEVHAHLCRADSAEKDSGTS